MKYIIMKFTANTNYQGKEIEVKKVTSKNGNKSAVELIIELTKKFDVFVIDQEKRWADQEKFNYKVKNFIENQEKFNEYVVDVFKRNNLK